MQPPPGVKENIPLAPLTTLELGGPARFYAVAQTEGQLRELVTWASKAGLPLLLIGGGSNLVISDAGFDGLAIRVQILGARVEPNGEVFASAGEPWDSLVEQTVAAGLSGLECLSGIPGAAGAAPIQNVGAYGREVSELLTEVRVLDLRTGAVQSLLPDDCGFGYRDSRFKRSPGRHAVLSVRFALAPGAPAEVRYAELARRLEGQTDPRAVRAAVLELRRSKSMVWDLEDPNHRSVGSFFTNPVVEAEVADAVGERARALGIVERVEDMPNHPAPDGRRKLSAAWLIERSGVAKGLRRGAVGISSRHCLALVHHGGGTTAELLALAQLVRQAVSERFGVELEPEPNLIGCALPE